MDTYVLDGVGSPLKSAIASAVVSKRVRVFFIGCPTLDTAAASHLLLSQNTAQRAVQFEIYHYWIYCARTSAVKNPLRRLHAWYSDKSLPFSRSLDRRYRAYLDRRKAPAFGETISRDHWLSTCRDALKSYDEWFPTLDRKFDVERCPTIIVTEAPIAGGYISLTNDDVGLVSTAKWKSYFRPVSALDYILFSVQRLTLRLSYTESVGSHYPTRGCLWDFDPHQPDARIAILLGHICRTCESRLIAASNPETFVELSKLVANRWIGDKNIQFTPAATLAHIHKYDLSRSTGLSTSFLTRAWDSISAEVGKVVVEGIKWAVVLTIGLTLAAYFPDVFKKIKSQLNPDSNKEPATERASRPVPVGSDLRTIDPHRSSTASTNLPPNRPSLPPDRGQASKRSWPEPQPSNHQPIVAPRHSK